MRAQIWLIPLALLLSSASLPEEPAADLDNGPAAVVLFLFAVFLFGLTFRKKVVPPPEPPKERPLIDRVLDEIGRMDQLGPYGRFGGKMIASKDDVESYIFVAQVDKSHVRVEERSKAEARYRGYERTIQILWAVCITLLILVLLFWTRQRY